MVCLASLPQKPGAIGAEEARGAVGAMYQKSHEAKKPKSQEAKKSKSQEATKPRSQEATKPRSHQEPGANKKKQEKPVQVIRRHWNFQKNARSWKCKFTLFWFFHVGFHFPRQIGDGSPGRPVLHLIILLRHQIWLHHTRRIWLRHTWHVWFRRTWHVWLCHAWHVWLCHKGRIWLRQKWRIWITWLLVWRTAFQVDRIRSWPESCGCVQGEDLSSRMKKGATIQVTELEGSPSISMPASVSGIFTRIFCFRRSKHGYPKCSQTRKDNHLQFGYIYLDLWWFEVTCANSWRLRIKIITLYLFQRRSLSCFAHRLPLAFLWSAAALWWSARRSKGSCHLFRHVCSLANETPKVMHHQHSKTTSSNPLPCLDDMLTMPDWTWIVFPKRSCFSNARVASWAKWVVHVPHKLNRMVFSWSPLELLSWLQRGPLYTQQPLIIWGVHPHFQIQHRHVFDGCCAINWYWRLWFKHMASLMVDNQASKRARWCYDYIHILINRNTQVLHSAASLPVSINQHDPPANVARISQRSELVSPVISIGALLQSRHFGGPLHQGQGQLLVAWDMGWGVAMVPMLKSLGLTMI